MIPAQTPQIFTQAIRSTDAALASLNGAIHWAYVAFWADPIGQVDDFEKQAAACRMTALQVFESHQLSIGTLMQLKPDTMAWFAPPPFEAPFNSDGSVDRELLAGRWETYQESLPPTVG